MAEIKENDTIIDYEDFQQNPEIFPNIINKIKKNTENIFSHAKYGLVDKTGKEIISQCDTIVYTNWEVTDMNGEYHNTCYVAIIDTAYKVFDKNGNIISPNSDFYNYINQTTTYLDNEVALYGLKNYLGQIVLPPTYKMIGTLNYERMVVRKDNKLGFINSTGEVVIPIIYDEADSFRYGKAKVKQNGKSFFIDVSGNVVK
jgi:hypothetical protein